MSGYKEAQVTLEVTLKAKTGEAILVYYEPSDTEAWVPRSTLSWKSDKEVEELPRNTEFSCTMAEWVARSKGFI